MLGGGQVMASLPLMPDIVRADLGGASRRQWL